MEIIMNKNLFVLTLALTVTATEVSPAKRHDPIDPITAALEKMSMNNKITKPQKQPQPSKEKAALMLKYMDEDLKHKYVCSDPLQTQLHKAAKSGDIQKMQKLLVVPEILVNATNSNGSTPLHCAAEKGHWGCTHALLSAPGILVNTTDFNGSTPLHCAAERGHTNSLIVLLRSQDIDINAQDNWKNTPLHDAACNGHMACVFPLLEKGAQNTPNCHNQKASDVAKTREIREIILAAQANNEK